MQCSLEIEYIDSIIWLVWLARSLPDFENDLISVLLSFFNFKLLNNNNNENIDISYSFCENQMHLKQVEHYLYLVSAQ